MLPRRHPVSSKFWTPGTDISTEGPGWGQHLDIRDGCFRGGYRVLICFGYAAKKFSRRTPQWMLKSIPRGFRSGDIRDTDIFLISLWYPWMHIRHGCIRGYHKCIRYPWRIHNGCQMGIRGHPLFRGITCNFVHKIAVIYVKKRSS